MSSETKADNIHPPQDHERRLGVLSVWLLPCFRSSLIRLTSSSRRALMYFTHSNDMSRLPVSFSLSTQGLRLVSLKMLEIARIELVVLMRRYDGIST